MPVIGSVGEVLRGANAGDYIAAVGSQNIEAKAIDTIACPDGRGRFGASTIIAGGVGNLGGMVGELKRVILGGEYLITMARRRANSEGAGGGSADIGN